MAGIQLDFFYAHPADRVWRALTDSRLLADWFMENDFVARPGHSFRLRPVDLAGLAGVIAADVIEVVEQRRLDMVWHTEDMHIGMMWQLHAVAGGTVLELVQTGYLGVHGTSRRRLMRQTYERVFGTQLPSALGVLAVRAGESTRSRPEDR